MGQIDAKRPPIIQYWHREEIPDDVAGLIATVRDLNPDLDHMVFSERDARAFIAEHFTEREVAAFDKCAVPAMQADYFRYCAVLALGGIYVDADFRCLQALRRLAERFGENLVFRSGQGNLVNGLFIFEDPGHPFLRLALDVATTNIERNVSEKVQKVTGPWVFSGLESILLFGSIEAARKFASGRKLEPIATAMFDAVADFERLTEAFDDLCSLPLSEASDWVVSSNRQLAYKQTDTHWVNWHRTDVPIFRPRPGENLPS